jgi:hypothetical protein
MHYYHQYVFGCNRRPFFLQQCPYLSQRDTFVAISISILPRMGTLLRDLVSIATKWLPHATEIGCCNIMAILQCPCILFQYTTYIATKHVLVTSKLNHGNMRDLLPQTWKWWHYCVLLQWNVVVAIKIVAIDRNPCSACLVVRGKNGMDYFWPTDGPKAYGSQKRIRSDSCWIRSWVRPVINRYGKGYSFTDIRPYPKIYHISWLYPYNIRQNIRQWAIEYVTGERRQKRVTHFVFRYSNTIMQGTRYFYMNIYLRM